jgi:aldose 1-epimerase
VTIANGGLSATVLTYGATLQDIRLAGTPWPLTLGSDSIAAYETTMRYFGAIVGPVANRIAGAMADIGGAACRFDPNEGGRTTLHGGAQGTSAQIWRIVSVSDIFVAMELDLPDGQGGFPGNRTVTATFSILAPATLRIELVARTDRETILSLANHSYWNLDGAPDTSGQTLRIAADRYTPVDADLIPTGEARAVDGTAFDFRNGRMLGPETSVDHNFCLTGDGTLREAVRMTGARGVGMTIATTAPGVQVYTGSRMETSPAIGLTGQPYAAFGGVAIEPQFWPDAPHHSGFPSVLLRPGALWRQESTWSFRRDED